MDLFRTLRISLYLLAATGAFAISVAEGSLFYLVLVTALGAVSCFTIDRGKAKPLSAEVTAAVTLVLFYLSMRHLRTEERWQSLPAAVAHFLCAFQALLFFCEYSVPISVMFFLAFAAVGMSSVVNSGPSLVARVACFVAVSVWTLYIHSVWRSRQEFSGQSTFLNGLGEKRARGQTPDPLRKLPEGAFWGTLALVGGMTVACIVLGVCLFFSAPRIDGILALFDRRTASTPTPGSISPIEAGQDPRGSSAAGISETVNIKGQGNIALDSRFALKATFSKPAALLAGKKNRILLKHANFSEYRGGVWVPEKARYSVESKNGAPIPVHDPSLDGLVFQGEKVTQSVETVLTSPHLFAAGPIVLAGMRKIEVDDEGAVRSAGGLPPDRYTLTISAPYDAAHLPDGAQAEHAQIQRYIRQSGLPPNASEAVLTLARQMTQHTTGDPDKARAIQRWLETHRRYTRNLEHLRTDADPIANFLLSTEPGQQVGHCGLFASAFVILCRDNNMPARLCDGFAAHLDSADPQSKSVVATNSDAHAWAEIYYQGIGWVTYDPAPASLDDRPDSAPATALSSKKKPGAAAGASASASAIAGADGEVSRGVVQDAWDALLKFDSREQRKWYEKLSGARTGGGGGLLFGGGWGGWLGAALAWIGIAAAIGWLVQLFSKRGTRRKFAAGASGGRARAAVGFYNDLLQALSRRGYSRRPGQTPREFADAVLKRGGATYAPVRDVTEIFEAVRYGGGELGQDEFNRLQEALDKIREMTL